MSGPTEPTMEHGCFRRADAAGADGGRDVAGEIALAREAQAAWAEQSVGQRLRLIRRVRHRIADCAERLAQSVQLPQRTSVAETLAADVLPLADACRFLERSARRALGPRKLGARGRPAWLWGLGLEVHREPYGVILIIAPWNYPLLLPGVHTLQALVAGNAAVIKPGRSSTAAAAELADVLYQSGLDERLVRVLPESPEAARAAIEAGVDKVVLTGSALTGQAVLSQLAPHLTPATMELSGCDAVFVRADADVDLVVKALAFGLRLNGGATCIAPRRVFVHESLASTVERRLASLVRHAPEVPVDPAIAESARTLVAEAIDGGARLVAGRLDGGEKFGPVVVADAAPQMRLLRSDVFAPVMALVCVASDEAALAVSRQCPYALGAAVFGRVRESQALAARIRAGCVMINDLIVPTADPRLPFGGRGRSGFGVTRGIEGLLEMTAVKAVAVRRGGWMPHLDPPDPEDAALMRAYLAASHGGSIRRRLAAAVDLLRAVAARRRAGQGDDEIPKH